MKSLVPQCIRTIILLNENDEIPTIFVIWAKSSLGLQWEKWTKPTDFIFGHC